MNIGDYVEYVSHWTKNNPWTTYSIKGIVVETGKYTGNNDCLIMLDKTGEILPVQSDYLEVLQNG